MSSLPSTNKFDLEQRTFKFAVEVRRILLSGGSTVFNQEDKKQLIRSSGSIGANYIEANEAISSRDFLLRIKICRKEAKESYFWLRLMIESAKQEDHLQLKTLEQEALELTRIFGAIVVKVEKKIN